MEQIHHANIPLRLKNVKNPEGSGTIIYPSQSSGTSSPKSDTSEVLAGAYIPNSGIASFMSANGYYGESQCRRTPTALTSKESIVLINIQSNRERKSHGFLAHVFQTLNEKKAVADLITSSEQSVSLAISSLEDDIERTKNLIVSLEKCGKVCEIKYSITTNAADIWYSRLRFYMTWRLSPSLDIRCEIWSVSRDRYSQNSQAAASIFISSDRERVKSISRKSTHSQIIYFVAANVLEGSWYVKQMR